MMTPFARFPPAPVSWFSMPKPRTRNKLKGRLPLLRELYEVERLPLREVADRMGVSYQAVHQKLRAAGVPIRSRAEATKGIPKRGRVWNAIARDTLLDMYVKQRLTAKEIGERLGRSEHTVYRSLKCHGIPRRRRKYPELEALNVGESLKVQRPPHRVPGHHNYYYSMAKSIGIRLSVRTLDDGSVRLTRVA